MWRRAASRATSAAAAVGGQPLAISGEVTMAGYSEFAGSGPAPTFGTNGHIGFNEPGPSLTARTHRVTLKPETRKSNAALFGGDPDAVPAEALSMGMGTILEAKSAVLIATGERKAACVEQLVTGPITTQLPASFLQLRADADLILDAAAAGQLTR